MTAVDTRTESPVDSGIMMSGEDVNQRIRTCRSATVDVSGPERLDEPEPEWNIVRGED